MWLYLEYLFKEVIQFKWGHWGGPSSNMTGVFLRRRDWYTDIHGVNIMWHREKTAVFKTRREASGESSPLKQHRDLRLPTLHNNCEEINFYCLSHSVHGILYDSPSNLMYQFTDCLILVSAIFSSRNFDFSP